MPCSFMVITLSRSSGQETSECNGSAGSPLYGFMKVHSCTEESVTCLLLSTDQESRMKNVKQLIQGDTVLTDNTQGLFLTVPADLQSLLIFI